MRIGRQGFVNNTYFPNVWHLVSVQTVTVDVGVVTAEQHEPEAREVNSKADCLPEPSNRAQFDNENHPRKRGPDETEGDLRGLVK